MCACPSFPLQQREPQHSRHNTTAAATAAEAGQHYHTLSPSHVYTRVVFVDVCLRRREGVDARGICVCARDVCVCGGRGVILVFQGVKR